MYRETLVSLVDVSFEYKTKRRDFKQMISLAKHETQVQSFSLHLESLELKEGDRLGVIGLNGAGKTTLLRIASRILIPTSGKVEVNGKLSTILGDGYGFEMEMSGEENVRTRLLLQGYSGEQLELMIRDVKEFADLGQAFYLPVKTYSSGMLLKLGFSATTSTRPEILVMDEIIGAGDASFVRKAQIRVDEFIRSSSALILASHNAEYLKMYCTHGMWMENGRQRSFGSINTILDEYYGSIQT